MSQLKKPTEPDHTKQKNRKWAAWLIIILGMGLIFFFMIFSITKGAAQIPIDTVWNALFHFNEKDTYHAIVVDLRLPRVIASALVGASLAVAGAVMQGLTRNPMADSGLMGLNAGSGFALSICFAFFPGLSYIQLIIFSFFGACLGTVLVNGTASLRHGGATPMRLVLAGAAVSALLTALSQGIASYFDVEQSILFWTTGGVAGSDWSQIRIMVPWIVVALFGAIVLSRTISVISLGDEVAKGLGVNIRLAKFLCSIVVLMLAGVSVAVVGAVGFVGLIVPHLARFSVGMDYRWVIPCSAVLGGLLVVLADLGARMLNPPFETPLGAVIGLIGVPFFLYLARKERRGL